MEESAQLNDIERESDSLEKRRFTGRMIVNPIMENRCRSGWAIMFMYERAVMAVPAHDTELGLCQKV